METCPDDDCERFGVFAVHYNHAGAQQGRLRQAYYGESNHSLTARLHEQFVSDLNAKPTCRINVRRPYCTN